MVSKVRDVGITGCDRTALRLKVAFCLRELGTIIATKDWATRISPSGPGNYEGWSSSRM